MSNSDQNNQAYRQWHGLISQLTQIGEFYDGKLRNLEQQVETLAKNNIPKHETEKVPNNPEKKTK